MNRETTHKMMLDPGVIAIVRGTKSVVVADLAEALFLGGVRAVEMTLTTPSAIESIEQVPADTHEKMAIGMGTVLTVDEAVLAIEAGSRFVVTPVLRPEVVAECSKRGVPIVCGAYTPTEAQLAHEAGADFVKLFPADGLGPSYVKSLLAPLPHLRIIPTGGITFETCGAFVKAGCVAVAAGSSLVTNEILESKDWRRITERAKKFVNAMMVARGTR